MNDAYETTRGFGAAISAGSSTLKDFYLGTNKAAGLPAQFDVARMIFSNAHLSDLVTSDSLAAMLINKYNLFDAVTASSIAPSAATGATLAASYDTAISTYAPLEDLTGSHDLVVDNDALVSLSNVSMSRTVTGTSAINSVVETGVYQDDALQTAYPSLVDVGHMDVKITMTPVLSGVPEIRRSKTMGRSPGATIMVDKPFDTNPLIGDAYVMSYWNGKLLLNTEGQSTTCGLSGAGFVAALNGTSYTLFFVGRIKPNIIGLTNTWPVGLVASEANSNAYNGIGFYGEYTDRIHAIVSVGGSRWTKSAEPYAPVSSNHGYRDMGVASTVHVWCITMDTNTNTLEVYCDGIRSSQTPVGSDLVITDVSRKFKMTRKWNGGAGGTHPAGIIAAAIWQGVLPKYQLLGVTNYYLDMLDLPRMAGLGGA